MGPLVPIVAVLVAGTAYKVNKDKKAKLTPKRKMILETAMNSKLTPEQLTNLANAFDKEGLKVEADLLRKRVNLQTAPQDQKDKWAAAFKKAMDSENIAAIGAVADAFEASGATGAAAALKARADGLRTGAIVAKAKVPDFVPPPAAVAAVVPPTAPTVGPQSDLTSSMNQGQMPAMTPVGHADPQPLTQTGAPGGASGLGETTVLPSNTGVVATPAAIAATLGGAGASATVLVHPTLGLSSITLPPDSPTHGVAGASPDIHQAMVAVAAANPTSNGPTPMDTGAAIGSPSDPTSSMNQK